jgi:hypothetical protein
LIGDTPGAKILTIGDATKKGFFSPHLIFTGIISLYEGVTVSSLPPPLYPHAFAPLSLIFLQICYPDTLGPLQVLATSTDDHPGTYFLHLYTPFFFSALVIIFKIYSHMLRR